MSLTFWACAEAYACDCTLHMLKPAFSDDTLKTVQLKTLCMPVLDSSLFECITKYGLFKQIEPLHTDFYRSSFTNVHF